MQNQIAFTDLWYTRDLLLLSVFALQHSLGTTGTAYNALAKITKRPYLWNAIYNCFTIAIIWMTVKFWLPSNYTIWHLTGVGFYLVQGIQILSVVMFFYFFKYTSFTKWLGVQQVYRMIKGQPQETAYTFKTHGFKRYVRFPHHTCLIVLFWSMPHMTLDLLLLAIFMTFYTWAGTVHQDFRGIGYLGEPWKEYRRNSRLIFPAFEMLLSDLLDQRRAKAGFQAEPSGIPAHVHQKAGAGSVQ